MKSNNAILDSQPPTVINDSKRVPSGNLRSCDSVSHESTGGTGGTTNNDIKTVASSAAATGGTEGTLGALNPIAAALAHAKHAVTQVSVPNDLRPCFRVYDQAVVLKEGGRKLRAGVYWHERLSDKEDASAKSKSDIFICGPLHLEAQTADTAGNSYGRLLRFETTRGIWRQYSLPMHLLRSDGAEVRGELLDMGLAINPDQRQRLNQYLQGQVPARLATCATTVGWAGKSFVLPHEVIGDASAQVVFQADGRVGDECAVQGSLDEWRRDVARLAVGNSLMLISLCAAFAGPLLRDCHAENGGIHIIGNSSSGKSTLLKVAASAWGGSGYRRSWRATSNGLEGAAALHNDALLALDEISEADPREVGSIIYMLGNGVSKTRASRTGGSRPVTRWRVIVMSTGEFSLGATMEEAGARQKAGHAVRLLDLPANRQHGVFDELHEFTSGALLSNHLQSSAEAHFGHAARRFIAEMITDPTDHAAALAKLRESAHFDLPGMDQQEVRAAARFALLAYAGELASHYGITGWDPGVALQAAKKELAKWRQMRGGGRKEHMQILEALTDFIDRHGDGRFANVDSEIVIRDRAGWFVDGDDGRIYLFNSTALREALRGFDLTPALNLLEELGVLPAAKADGKRVSTRRIRGEVVKVYQVNAGRLRAAFA